MAPYKVAVVGAGMVANVGHIPAWLELASAVEVVGVFNHTLAKAQQTADRHGIPHAYDDYGRMMDELRPDIVSVCTLNVSHRAYTKPPSRPAPSPKQGETDVVARNGIGDTVSIRSPHRSKGRHLIGRY